MQYYLNFSLNSLKDVVCLFFLSDTPINHPNIGISQYWPLLMSAFGGKYDLYQGQCLTFICGPLGEKITAKGN